eukprot:scaffold241302_cov30-Tisochrysis_lutea.AAC.1
MATPVANDSTLAVLAPFEVFQAARLDFAQDLARLAAQGRPGAASLAHEVDSLEKILAALEASDTLVMDIAPLVADLAPSVQQSAMIAMGRMCSLSSSLCIKVAQPDLLRHVVETVTRVASPSLLKAALFFLHASALSSADVAIELVELGVLAPLCERVEALDPGTKTDAVWCLAAIAKHNAELAKAVANSGVLPLLKLCLKEPSLPLRRITLSCIGCIGQHSEELASILSKDGLLADILPMLRHRDLVLRRHACRALAVSVQHLSDLGFWKPEATTDLLACLGSASAGDAETAAYGAALVGQLCKGSNSVAGACNEGGAGPLLTALLRNPKAPTVPVALALGHLCSASAASAAAALDHGALDALLSLLEAQPPMHVCAALTVCMGAIGGADAGCAATFAASGALLAMARATILSRRKMSTTTTAAARGGVIAALSRCIDYPSLVQLFEETPLPAPASDTPPPSDGSAQPLDEAAVYAALLKALAAAFAKNGNHRHDFMSRGHLAH